MPTIEISFKDIIFDPNVHSYCVSKKFTCPNYGTSWSCPPAADILDTKIATYNRFFLIYIKIDQNEFILEHIEDLNYTHIPVFQRKLNDLINKQANREISFFLQTLNEDKENIFVLWPEKCKICENASKKCTYLTQQPCRNPEERHYSMTGAGVNMDRTAKNINIALEWPPKKYTYRFGLVCLK